MLPALSSRFSPAKYRHGTEFFKRMHRRLESIAFRLIVSVFAGEIPAWYRIL